MEHSQASFPSFGEYIDQSARFVKYTNGLQRRRCVTAGLIGELGEVAELLKKSQRDSTELDMHAVALELGDVLWYIARRCEETEYRHQPYAWEMGPGLGFDEFIHLERLSDSLFGLSVSAAVISWCSLCRALGFTPAEIALMNIEKLTARHAA